MSLQNNALYSILYSTAKNVSARWSMYVWVCPKCDCNCVRVPLMWPSVLSLCYQAFTPSPSLSALLSYNFSPAIWCCHTLWVCAPVNFRTRKINIRQPDTSRYRSTKYPIYSLTKYSPSQSPACSGWSLSPWHPDEGNEPAREWQSPLSQNWFIRPGTATPSAQGDLQSPGYGWKFLLDHFRWSMISGQ